MVVTSHRSPVAFPFPPRKVPSDPTLPGGSAGLAQHTKGSLEEPRMEHGLQAFSCSDPRSSVQVSNLSQEVTSASAELHPPSCHPAPLFGANHKMQRPQETPRQTSEAGKKGIKPLECPTHVGDHLHKPLVALGEWRAMVAPGGTESFHSIPETLSLC